MMEFHVSRQARDRYQFDQELFSLNGSVLFANFHAARVFAQRMNQKRDLLSYPEQAVRAGQINALGMVDEILHYVFYLYREQVNPQARTQALAHLVERLGPEPVDAVLARFADAFPPMAVYRREMDVDQYLRGSTDGTPNRELLLEELMMLWLSNRNPATAPFLELFDDSDLQKETAYPEVVRLLGQFFATQPPFGPDQQPIHEMLRSPAIAVPHSLTGQLEYIRERWFTLLGRYVYRLLGSLDLVREEEKAIFFGMGGGGGPGPIPVPVYRGSGIEGEPERYSPDREWMPSLVLIAKNAFVWLDQLGRQYGRPIRTLAEIPDAELDRLARAGISGLWLIGLWERSTASARIKQIMGNREAVASAYSLYAYDIARDLGGPDAYASLRDRAWQRGIRLASDMVPNHMGIDSPWVTEHPEWFLSLPYSPFPSYTFNGPDLSNDPRVAIHLEDHYYDRTDAAVVFKRTDRGSGETQYIYHGNDGTSMPWNDTAQLNYLNPAVREAVIQTILHVARQFPIIRFDAAMTLAKKHYQRLWFPEPGTGGAIPSRAEYGLTREQFDAQMPEEFWREVVDRVAREAPDTLLLAEAFWLMESYFVRSLGMHRVYNSAFMNLLRNEENAKYRTILKNTLEFDPQILKRFVNFMNNPDEKTAVEQFGKGDKYFGIATLMATLPGLPMFGHGQIEGYAEKYGMEYRRAYLDEQPDAALIARHEREIFPLLHRRRVFAEVDNFLLYDFFTHEGWVNEDVYAYSNAHGGERGLVVYHNKFEATRGFLRESASYASRGSGVVRRSLAEGLGLQGGPGQFVVLHDQASGLEYIRPSQEIVERGLYLELGAYKTYAFVDIQEVTDDDQGRYRQLYDFLGGRGVPSIREALQELFLQPLHTPLNALLEPEYIRRLMPQGPDTNRDRADEALADLVPRLTAFYQAAAQRVSPGPGAVSAEDLAMETGARVRFLRELRSLSTRYPLPGSQRYQAAAQFLAARDEPSPVLWITLYGWALVSPLGRLRGKADTQQVSLTWIDEWQLGRLLAGAARALGASPDQADQVVRDIKVLTGQQGWYEEAQALHPVQAFEALLVQPEISSFLGINRYQDVLWFNREAYHDLLWWLLALAVAQVADGQHGQGTVVERAIGAYDLVSRFAQAEAGSEYQLARLVAGLRAELPAAARPAAGAAAGEAAGAVPEDAKAPGED